MTHQAGTCVIGFGCQKKRATNMLTRPSGIAANMWAELQACSPTHKDREMRRSSPYNKTALRAFVKGTDFGHDGSLRLVRVPRAKYGMHRETRDVAGKREDDVVMQIKKTSSDSTAVFASRKAKAYIHEQSMIVQITCVGRSFEIYT